MDMKSSVPEILQTVADALEQTLDTVAVAVVSAAENDLRYYNGHHGIAEKLCERIESAALIEGGQGTPEADIDLVDLPNTAYVAAYPVMALRGATDFVVAIAGRDDREQDTAWALLQALAREATSELLVEMNAPSIHAAIEDVPVGISIASMQVADAPLVYVNAGFERLTGYTSCEVIGRNCRFLQCDLSNAPERRVLREALAEGQGCTVEMENVRKDGQHFINRLKLRPVYTGTARPSHYIGFQNDITAQREAEKASESIIGAAPVAMLIADSGGFIRRANHHVESIFRAPADDLMGESVDMLVPESQRGRHRDLRAAFQAAPTKRPMGPGRELYGLRKDGTEFPIEVGLSHYQERGETRIIAAIADITERKQLHDSLRAKKDEAERARREARRLAMVAEKTDNAVVITDEVGRIEWVNAGFSEITGWSLDQAMGRKPGEFLQGPETSEAHRAALTKAISNAEALTTEFVNYHADGHPYWVEIDMQPVLGDDGAPAHFISIQRDVSRRKAQDALAQARSDVFERIAAGADQADVLEALARALGNGAIGMTASILARDEAGERLHVAAAPGLPPRYRDALNGLVIGPGVGGCGTAAFNAERCVAEDIFAHPNWRDHETLANLSGMRACWSQPVQSEDGKVQGVLELYAPRSRAPGQWEIELLEQAAALCANVLMHFEVMAAENASHRRLASMAEAVPVPVVYLGRDAVVKYANAAYASYHNTERDKMVGTQLPEIVGAKAWAGLETPFRDALTGRRQCFEARLEYRPDNVRDARINLVPEFAGDGSVTGVYKVSEDLTEFRRRERELRSAYEAAEYANKAKSNFLANMSHELRTPLNAILGYTDIMKQQMFGPLGSERYVGYINDIHASGSYLLDLLKDILDLASVDAGGRELAYDRVDLQEAIECAVLMQGQRKADVRVRHCDPLSVLADERAVKQVLVNVVDNALTYGGEKGVDIDVVQTAVDTVSVTVSDFGPGIAPDELAHVTEPFYTGKRSAMVAKQGTEGTGVGLALSKRLSEAMGRSLTIESEVGQGTNVTISFPLAPEPTEPAL